MELATQFGVTLLDLSRWQFAITVIFHMIFPAITVGLAIFLCVVYGIYWRTGKALYLQIFRFWRRIFAVAFAIGVVAGATITFELGLNWGQFAAATGPIIGPIIGMEVVTAFFVEAAFIGVMLYGDGRVKPRTMYIASLMVALGTIFSVTWIIAANSWMQVPVSYELVNGQFHPVNWVDVILNPAFLWRFPHMLLAVLLSSAWLLAGLSAYYLVKGRALPVARKTFSIALGIAAVVIPFQLMIGDTVAINVIAKYQLSKITTLEGHYESTEPWYNVLVWPDQANQRNVWELRAPCLGSYMAAHDFSCQSAFPGMKLVPVEEQPNELLTFYGFRTMWYASMLMFALSFASVVMRIRGKLWTSRKFHKFILWMAPIGILAIIGGWVTAEAGRQPWVVYGLLRTDSAVSGLATPELVATLIGFILIYVLLLTVFIAYVVHTMRIGPERDAVVGEGEEVAPSAAESLRALNSREEK